MKSGYELLHGPGSVTLHGWEAAQEDLNLVGQVCRMLGVSEQSYYRWRREYGGLKIDQAKRLKDLAKENVRLRRAVSDLTLDKLILKEALEGNY